MKKYNGILLLVIFTMPLFTTFIAYKIQKRAIRKEVKQRIIKGLTRDELTLLKFSAADAERLLEWEHSKEFEYNDEMYDVVEQAGQGDTLWYWCILDTRETLANFQFENLVAVAWGHKPEGKQNVKLLLNFWDDIFIDYIPGKLNPFIYKGNLILTKKNILVSLKLPVESPPPELA